MEPSNIMDEFKKKKKPYLDLSFRDKTRVFFQFWFRMKEGGDHFG